MQYGMDYMGGSPASGGGGYGGGGGGFNTQSSSGGRGGGGGSRKSYDEQTIQPCTIGMLLHAKPEAGTEDLELPDGRKLYHVAVIGAIREFSDYSTNTEYNIEDGTGSFTVKQWVDDSSTAKLEMRQLTMKDHLYVKVIGKLKYYEGNIQLVADMIRPLSSGNELTHHMLEVVYLGEKYKKSHGSMRQPLFHNNVPGVGFGSNVPIPTAHAGGGGLMNKRTGNGIREIVIDYIKREGERDEAGVNIHEMIRKFKDSNGEENVQKAIEDLAAEGLIYSTVNEEYFKFAM